MANIETSLKEAMAIEGAIGVALVDYTSGLTLGVLGGSPTLDMNIAAAGNTDVVRAKVRTLEMLGLGDNIEDILITLDTQYHLIRLLQTRRGSEALFLYLALNKSRANLGLARHQLRKIETDLDV
jgi:UDP-2,3-diacylglucosamine pyrophosphatase LpxH